jgi:hypothetical protein
MLSILLRTIAFTRPHSSSEIGVDLVAARAGTAAGEIRGTPVCPGLDVGGGGASQLSISSVVPSNCWNSMPALSPKRWALNMMCRSDAVSMAGIWWMATSWSKFTRLMTSGTRHRLHGVRNMLLSHCSSWLSEWQCRNGGAQRFIHSSQLLLFNYIFYSRTNCY